MLVNDKIEQTCTTSTKVASRILTQYVGVLCSSLRMAEVSPRLSLLRDVSRGGTSATQRQKFHTDDLNQCLHNKSGSHGAANVN